jgi:hypothetical protein
MILMACTFYDGLVAVQDIRIIIKLIIICFVIITAMEKASPRLMKAEMRSVSLSLCNESYSSESGKLPRAISNFGHLCAQDRNGTADACNVRIILFRVSNK